MVVEEQFTGYYPEGLEIPGLQVRDHSAYMKHLFDRYGATGSQYYADLIGQFAEMEHAYQWYPEHPFDKVFVPERLFPAALDLLLNRSIALVVIPGLIPDEICKEVHARLEEVGIDQRADGVTLKEIGTTHYGSTPERYLEESLQAREQLEELLDGINPMHIVDELLRSSLSPQMQYRPMRINNKEVTDYRVRLMDLEADYQPEMIVREKILEPGKFELAHGLVPTRQQLTAHEDLEQAYNPVFTGTELEQVAQQGVMLGANVCIANDMFAPNNQLNIWNRVGDVQGARKLGLTSAGYPYPLRELVRLSRIKYNPNPGDFYILLANLQHGVFDHTRRPPKEVPTQSARATIARNMGLVDQHTLVGFS